MAAKQHKKRRCPFTEWILSEARGTIPETARRRAEGTGAGIGCGRMRRDAKARESGEGR